MEMQARKSLETRKVLKPNSLPINDHSLNQKTLLQKDLANKQNRPHKEPFKNLLLQMTKQC